MYEELIKELRSATGWKNASAHYSLMNRAADAIEELSCKYQKALGDLVKRAEPPKEEKEG